MSRYYRQRKLSFAFKLKAGLMFIGSILFMIGMLYISNGFKFNY